MAALLVVLTHAWEIPPALGVGDMGRNFDGGASGVDIFFVISGFIMVYITGGTPISGTSFIRARIARIAPPYWLMTLVMSVALLSAPSSFGSSSFSFTALITSLAFIPWPSSAVNGAAPLLTIGWTLNYEMLFYVLFAVAMMCSQKRRVGITAIFVFLLISLQAIWPNDINPWYQFFTSTIMLEFVFGMLLGSLAKAGKLPGGSRGAILFSALLFLVSIFVFESGRLHEARFLVWGVPAAILVAAVAMCDLSGKIPTNAFLLLLGNASYAIYLTHLFSLGILQKFWPHMPGWLRFSDVVLISFSICAALLGGVVFYWFIERPLVRVARAWATGKRGSLDVQAGTPATVAP